MIKDIFTKKENQTMLILIIISVILIISGFYFLNKNGENGLEPRKIPSSINEVIWKNYSNNEFGFKLEYPEHFNLYEGDASWGPAINFYLDKRPDILPISFYSNENINHISVYPLGVAAGGPLGYFEESEYKNTNNFDFEVKQYKTYNGETWGASFKPKQTPDKWQPFGFIWISSKIDNKEYKCFNNSVEKDIELCDPYSGDEFYLIGEVDSEFVELSREIIDRLSFE